jgi:hypothetical protein
MGTYFHKMIIKGSKRNIPCVAPKSISNDLNLISYIVSRLTSLIFILTH